MSAKENAVVNTSWLNPMRDGIITSLGGLRTNPVTKKTEFHDGVDIACPVGTEIFTSHNGKVLAAGLSPSFGYYLKLSYINGYTAVFAHLSELKVKTNDEIARGQIVAYSGNTGRSTGPHLHYSLFKSGQYVNASKYVALPVNDRIMAMGGSQ